MPAHASVTAPARRSVVAEPGSGAPGFGRRMPKPCPSLPDGERSPATRQSSPEPWRWQRCCSCTPRPFRSGSSGSRHRTYTDAAACRCHSRVACDWRCNCPGSGGRSPLWPVISGFPPDRPGDTCASCRKHRAPCSHWGWPVADCASSRPCRRTRGRALSCEWCWPAPPRSRPGRCIPATDTSSLWPARRTHPQPASHEGIADHHGVRGGSAYWVDWRLPHGP